MDTRHYWDDRYKAGGNSGSGNFGRLGQYKVDFLNRFIDVHNIESIVDIGFGDGYFIKQLGFQGKYTGFEISSKAVDLCSVSMPRYTFKLVDDYDNERADMSMSIDVMYHMVNEDDFKQHIDLLQRSSNKYIVVFADDTDTQQSPQASHVMQRKFSDKLGEFKLIHVEPHPYPWNGDGINTTWSKFHIFRR